jgi:hypothetical protein
LRTRIVCQNLLFLFQALRDRSLPRIPSFLVVYLYPSPIHLPSALRFPPPPPTHSLILNFISSLAPSSFILKFSVDLARLSSLWSILLFF